MKHLTVEEEKEVQGGEAITLSAIMGLLAIGLIAVVCYKLFFSGNEGKVTLPGGFTFQWGD